MVNPFKKKSMFTIKKYKNLCFAKCAAESFKSYDDIKYIFNLEEQDILTKIPAKLSFELHTYANETYVVNPKVKY